VGATRLVLVRESLEPQHVTSKVWYVRGQIVENDVVGKQLLITVVVLVSCCSVSGEVCERATESGRGEEEGLSTMPRRPQHLAPVTVTYDVAWWVGVVARIQQKSSRQQRCKQAMGRGLAPTAPPALPTAQTGFVSHSGLSIDVAVMSARLVHHLDRRLRT
jgi:hypothetical protein